MALKLLKVNFIVTFMFILFLGSLLPNAGSIWRVFLVLQIICIMALCTRSKNIGIIKSDSTFWLWLLFGIYAGISAFFFAIDYHHSFEGLITYFSYLVLYLSAYLISKNDNDVSFVSNGIGYLCFCVAMLLIITGLQFDTNGRLMGIFSYGSNTVATYMMLGIAMLFIGLRFSTNISNLFRIVAIAIMMFVLLLTGSRKYFIGACVFVILWFVFCYKKLLAQINRTRRIILVACTIGIIVLVAIYLQGAFKSTTMFTRMIQLIVNPTAGDMTRYDMYAKGFSYFKENPLFGIGYQNFELLYYNLATGGHTYSHSTYIEALSCTGIIGAFLYFLPYFLMGRDIWRNLKQDNETNSSYVIVSRMSAMVLIVFIWVGIGSINYYDCVSFAVFGVISAMAHIGHEQYGQTNIEKRKIKIVMKRG